MGKETCSERRLTANIDEDSPTLGKETCSERGLTANIDEGSLTLGKETCSERGLTANIDGDSPTLLQLCMMLLRKVAVFVLFTDRTMLVRECVVLFIVRWFSLCC